MDATKMEALGALVDEVDAAGGPTPEQAQQIEAEASADAGAREWGVIAFTIGGALSMFLPELKQVYTEEACLNWGRSVVPVAEKYGWGSTGKVPELGLLLATLSLALPTAFCIRHRIKNPEQHKGGMFSQVRDWWREKRAKGAAAVVRKATDKAAEAANDGR
jgi:hypothetical protein